ncbi:MAG: GNAT family N-acetyltransferase [Caldilineaceae bacterium]
MISPTTLSAAQIMALHIQTLYVCDPQARLLTINELGNPPAPRFYLGRTQRGNQWRFRHDLPSTLVEQLEQLCQSEPVTTDLRQPPQNYAAIKAVLAEHAPIAAEYRGPAYWIPKTVQSPSDVTLITAANAALVRPYFAWLLELDARQSASPVVAALVDRCAVSICFCSRIPGQATEAGLETHSDFRRRGYATAVVAAWAAALYQQGCLPLYSTSWENVASQGVARKLGMVQYGEDWSVG